MTDDEERELHELKVAQMRADIANKEADTAYKQGLLRYEPWKLVLGSAAAGAAMLGAGAGIMVGILALVRWHTGQ
jgi:hypothetical protein